MARLVQKGLPAELQQALDIVRVTGNHAVHPGLMDLNDDREMVGGLFALVNTVAEEMISRPKAIREMYAKLPQQDRDKIAKRDQRAP